MKIASNMATRDIKNGPNSSENVTGNYSSPDTSNLQLKLISNLNKKHEILTILQLCNSHLKLQQSNSSSSNNMATDLLINNYLHLINKLDYKPFQVIWNLSKMYQQKDLYHLSVPLLKEYLDLHQSKVKYEDPFDEFIKQDISIQDLQLIQLDQEDQDTEDLIISEVWASLGHCYLMIEDLPNAYLTYQKALYILPNVKCSKLWKGIGILYDRYGSLDYAEEAFAKVLEIENIQDTLLKEDQNEIYFRLGIIYKHQSKYQQSLECFRFIINNPPPPLKECDIWFQLGQVCELLQDYENAKLAYTECCLLNGNHHKGWVCLAVMYLILQEAKISNYMEQGLSIDEEIAKNEDVFFEETRMALQCLNNHLRIDANDTLSWYYLGRAHLLLRDYQTSYEYYQNCINKDPNNANFWCSIGILYFAIGQYHDSLDAYSRAIRLTPYLWEVWYDLGVLYEACGDVEQQYKDAIDAFTQADRLRPNYYAIKSKLKHLLGEHVENSRELPKWLEPELPFQQTSQQNSMQQGQLAMDQTMNPKQQLQPELQNSQTFLQNQQQPIVPRERIEEVSKYLPQQELANKEGVNGNSIVSKRLDKLAAAAAMTTNGSDKDDSLVSIPTEEHMSSMSNGLSSLSQGPKKRGRKPKSLATTPLPEDLMQQNSRAIKKRGRPLGRKNKVSVDISSLTPLSSIPPNGSSGHNVIPIQNNLLYKNLSSNTEHENKLPAFNSVLNNASQKSVKGVKLTLAELATASAAPYAQKQPNGMMSIANTVSSKAAEIPEKVDNRLLNLVRAAETQSGVIKNENNQFDAEHKPAKGYLSIQALSEPSKLAEPTVNLSKSNANVLILPPKIDSETTVNQLQTVEQDLPVEPLKINQKNEEAVIADDDVAAGEVIIPIVVETPSETSHYIGDVEEEEVDELPATIDVEVGEVIRDIEEDEDYDE
ncbi:hypothetical protein QEN19_003790 [Hanseniaspora menglaensis]